MEQSSAVSVSTAGLPLEVDHLEHQVQAQLSGRVRRLRLLLVDDRIVLRGLARTYHAKQLAQHAVMQMTEVPILANEIEVT
jgi:hypothetical protein